MEVEVEDRLKNRTIGNAGNDGILRPLVSTSSDGLMMLSRSGVDLCIEQAATSQLR